MSSEKQNSDPPTARERLEGRLARLLSTLPGGWLLRLIGEEPLAVEGQRLDAHIQFILAARRRRPQHLLCEPTPAEGRRRYRREIAAVTESSGARPTRVGAVRSLTVETPAGPLAARHYVPLAHNSTTAAPLLVYLHGGGFVIGDLDTHDEPCRLLCHHGELQVLQVAYRLAPEHPFPAAVDDACAALRWAQQQAGALGADRTRICIGGDSAGANLAAVAALELAREGQAPAAQLLIYPTTDATAAYPSRRTFGLGFTLTAADMDAFTAHYLGDDPARRADPRASPAFAPDLAKSPPTLLTTAAFDPLRDEGEAYADALRRAGVVVQMRRMEGLVHGYLHMTTVVPAAQAALVETARLFRELLRNTGQRQGLRGSGSRS